MDKSALLVAYLATKGLDVNPDRVRDQQVRCPFHGPDRNPSASVNLGKGLFNCFYCGGGDVYKLIERHEDGVNTFEEALRFAEKLAPASGDAVPRADERSLSFIPRKAPTPRPGGGRFVPSRVRRRTRPRP